MNRISFATALMLVTSGHLAALENVRLVVSPHTGNNDIESASVPLSSSCIDVPNSTEEWCVPNRNANFIQSVVTPSRLVVSLPSHGYSAQYIAEYLTNSGFFGLVEPDILVQEVSTTDTPPSDDPYLSYQDSYFGSDRLWPVGMNVYETWANYDVSSEPVSVAIFDSSFFLNSDVSYSQGASFSTITNQSRSNDFSPRPENIAFCTGHGLGVAGTIGATVNNSEGNAGVSRNVALHPIRTLDCGSGYLSDNADAIDWLMGKSFDGVDPYTGDIGIINMSLSARVDHCPEFLQRTISQAHEQGWTIVVAAGNDYGEDVAEYTPANCEDVITVNAITSAGSEAVFSNVGAGVDFTAMGTEVYAVCTEGENTGVCSWSGTSFSAPLVAGVAAETRSITRADNQTIEQAMAISASRHSLSGVCLEGMCGHGVPNLYGTVEVVDLIQRGLLNRITHVLTDTDLCTQRWYLDYFGTKGRLCEMYNLTFSGGYRLPNQFFELYTSDSATENPNTTNWTLYDSFDEATVVISELNVQSLKFAVKTCDPNGCGSLIPISKEAIDMSPQACRDL